MPWACLGPGNLATGLGQALPLIISTPCFSCVLASTQHSNRQPGAAHISPTLTHFQPATSSGSFRSRLDRTLRCPIVRPHPLSQPFFSPPSSQLPAPGSSSAQKLACRCGKLEPRCQTRLLIRPPRTHPMPKADTSLLGAIGRITGNTGGFSGTEAVALAVCVCVRGSRSKLCLYS